MPKKRSPKLNIRPGRLAQVFTPIVLGAAVLGGVGTGVHKFFDGDTRFSINMYDDDLVGELPGSYKDYLSLLAEYQILSTFETNYYEDLVGDNEGFDVTYDQSQKAREEFDRIDGGASLLNGNRRNDSKGQRKILVGYDHYNDFNDKGDVTRLSVSEHTARVSRSLIFHYNNIYNAIYKNLDESLFESHKAKRAGTYDAWHEAQMQWLAERVRHLRDHELMPEEYSKGLKELRGDLQSRGYGNAANNQTATPPLAP